MQLDSINPRSIEIHNEQADHYSYRTPYISKVFEAVCKELGVTRNSLLMDVGCGRGEVAEVLSAYSRKVYAIDGSRSMVDLAVKRERIEYQVADLNFENPVIDEKVHHMFFGRSIHWFSSESLIRLASSSLVDNGNIVVCSTQWTPVGAWGQCYFRVKRKYLPADRPKSDIYDFTGNARLAGAGFSPLKVLDSDATIKVSVDFMIGHTFATTYGDNLRKLKSVSTQFAREMRECLKVFEDKQEIVMKVVTWAIIYGASKSKRFE